MKKRTRRLVVLVVLIGLFSSLAPLTKLLFAAPLTVLLLSDYDDFRLYEQLKKESFNNGK